MHSSSLPFMLRRIFNVRTILIINTFVIFF
jgi:hypothetical protein